MSDLRVITQRDAQAFAQSREFTHFDILNFAKFNKSTIESLGTLLAEVISEEQRSEIITHQR